MSDHICEDILIKILKVMTVRRLVQFRSVCKDWKRVIYSPAFLKEHISVQKPSFLVNYVGCRRINRLGVTDSQTHPLIHRSRKPIRAEVTFLVGTLHGVVCLLWDYSSFELWNPAMHKHSDRIHLPVEYNWRPLVVQENCYGFWIDPLTKEFKFIIMQIRDGIKCILYSSVRGEWSAISTEKKGYWANYREDPPVMIGGRVAYWGGYLIDDVILSFNFVRECIDSIEMAYPMISDYVAPCSWREKFSLLGWKKPGNPDRCVMYVRQEDSWVKMFNFGIDLLVDHVYWAMEDIEERKGGKSEPEVYVRVLATTRLNNSFAFYGTNTESEHLWRGKVSHTKVCIAYDYVESLLSPP